MIVPMVMRVVVPVIVRVTIVGENALCRRHCMPQRGEQTHSKQSDQ